MLLQRLTARKESNRSNSVRLTRGRLQTLSSRIISSASASVSIFAPQAPLQGTVRNSACPGQR